MMTGTRRTRYAIGLAWTCSLATGCDCIRQASAVVLDSRTLAPIEGVFVSERYGGGLLDHEHLVTNSFGRFDFSDISGPTCPPFTLHFAKEGYVPFDMEFGTASDADTVLLRTE